VLTTSESSDYGAHILIYIILWVSMELSLEFYVDINSHILLKIYLLDKYLSTLLVIYGGKLESIFMQYLDAFSLRKQKITLKAK
jgi:hypothetical protein